MYDDNEYTIPRGKKPVSEEVQKKTNRRIKVVAIILGLILLAIGVDWIIKMTNEHTHIITVTDKEVKVVHRSQYNQIHHYYVTGIREDGKEIKYDLGKEYSFLDIAGYECYEQIRIGKTYQFTVTGLCFGNEIVLWQ